MLDAIKENLLHFETEKMAPIKLLPRKDNNL